MIKKIAICTCLVMALSFPVFAAPETAAVPNSEKPALIPVAVMPLVLVDGNMTALPQSLTEVVTSVFVQSGRFHVLDRTAMEQVHAERELQKTADFIDSKIVAQGKNLGAQFIVTGNISNAFVRENRTQLKDGSSSVSYPAQALISLKVVSVETGEVKAATDFKEEYAQGDLITNLITLNPMKALKSLESGNSPEESLAGIVKDVTPKIRAFLLQQFTVGITIIKLEEVDGKEAEKVLISAGTNMGVKKGDKFNVVMDEILEVNGKKMVRKSKLGVLKVTSVDGEEISLCKVKDGGKEIFANFSSNKLQVVPKE